MSVSSTALRARPVGGFLRVFAGDALALAPLLCLYVVFSAVAQPGAEAVRDEPALLAAAQRILEGSYADTTAMADPRAYLWHGPGLPALLAPLVALDLPLTVIRFSGPLLLGAATLALRRLLRRHLSSRAALLWTYAFGLYAPFYTVLRQVHKEPLAILLVVGALLAMSRGLRHGRRRDVVAGGLALAALTLVRTEYGWVLLALLIAAAAWWAAGRAKVRARRLVAIAAVGLVACLPWLVYTTVLTDQPFYWSSSSGLSLYWMSPTLPGETGQWHSPRKVFTDPSLSRYRPFFARLETLPPLLGDRELKRAALANIEARPLTYARNVVANAARLFFFAPMTTPRSPVLIAGAVAFNGALLVGLAWAGRRLWARRGSLPPETAPFALLAVLAVGVHVFASAQPRMLLTTVPILLWLIAHGSSLGSVTPEAMTSGHRRPGTARLTRRSDW